MIKKTLLVLLLLLVVGVGGLAVVVAMQPPDFRVERTATVNAAPADVFAQVNDFHKWQAWSPWAKLDPDCKYAYEGPAAGTGAVFTWSGNKEVGEGRMTILDSRPGEMVRIKLDFLRPFESTCTAEFHFRGEGSQTAVTWSMFGKNDFVGKAFHLFMDIDQMVGGDFERGLAQLKAVAEDPARR